VARTGFLGTGDIIQNIKISRYLARSVYLSTGSLEIAESFFPKYCMQYLKKKLILLDKTSCTPYCQRTRKKKSLKKALLIGSTQFVLVVFTYWLISTGNDALLGALRFTWPVHHHSRDHADKLSASASLGCITRIFNGEGRLWLAHHHQPPDLHSNPRLYFILLPHRRTDHDILRIAGPRINRRLDPSRVRPLSAALPAFFFAIAPLPNRNPSNTCRRSRPLLTLFQYPSNALACSSLLETAARTSAWSLHLYAKLFLTRAPDCPHRCRRPQWSRSTAAIHKKAESFPSMIRALQFDISLKPRSLRC
jgi:hypothetical protein